MASDTPDILIFVTHEKLTDGSFVYAVRLGDLKMDALTKDHAVDLADAIVDAIHDHTNLTADSVIE